MPRPIHSELRVHDLLYALGRASRAVYPSPRHQLSIRIFPDGSGVILGTGGNDFHSFASVVDLVLYLTSHYR
jgi:hypothetical protein